MTKQSQPFLRNGRKHYLATTGISEIWDLEENRLLLLGPWCLINRENERLLEKRDYTIVPSPWKPASRIKEAAEYCDIIYEDLLAQLSDVLNTVHRVNHPIGYWRILIGPWLLHFIGIFYDRYKRIEKTIELFPDFYTHTLPKEQCSALSYDTYDFLGGKRDEHYYNLKLFSLIVYELCPHNAIRKDYKHESKVFVHQIEYSWRVKSFNRLMEVTDLFFKSPVVLCDMYHLTTTDMISLKFRGKFRTFRFIDFAPTDGTFLKNNYSSYSQETRDTIKLKAKDNRFQSLLYKILPDAIPICYVEKYRNYRESVMKIKNTSFVKMIGSTVGWDFNERFKFFAAEKSLKRVRMARFQHGGNYGVSLVKLDEEESFKKSIFYTWGWRSDRNMQTKPLPSPHLSKLKNTYQRKTDNLLVIGTDMPKYHYRFDTLLLPEDMPKYFEDKKIFLQLLPKEIQNKVLYRPSSYDFGWREKERVKKACPKIEFLLNEEPVKWMQKVRLVVIDHPHTSFLEALTINVPCVLYWDHEVYLVRREAQEYLELLRDADMLCADPVNAAKKVNEIFDDPMAWWSAKRIQKARAEFCEHFAYARRNWTDIWMEELRRGL